MPHFLILETGYVPEGIEFNPADCIPSDIHPPVDNDCPSGGGRGPDGIAWNVGRFSVCSSKSGSPSPARAQLTFESSFFNSSVNAKIILLFKMSDINNFSIYAMNSIRFMYLLLGTRDSREEIYNPGMLDKCIQQELYRQEDFLRTDPNIPSEINLKII